MGTRGLSRRRGVDGYSGTRIRLQIVLINRPVSSTMPISIKDGGYGKRCSLLNRSSNPFRPDKVKVVSI